MKKLKRIFSTLLVIAMLLVQIIPTTSVSAAGEGSIKIDNALEGETYSIYKMLSLVTYDADKNTYVYKVESAWESFITTGEGKNYLTIVDDAQDTSANNTYVIWKEKVSKDEVASLAEDAMAYAKANNITATKSATAPVEEDENTTTTVEFTGLDLGYYLVDSTLGAICGLTTTNPSANVNEKNTVPTVKKEVEENSTEEYGETNDAKIGDTVNFKTTITVGEGTENYVLYDKMSAGLTLDSTSIKVYVNSTAVSADNYTVNTTATDEYTFTISFANTYIATLEAGTEIVVEYSATLNKDAVIEGAGNPNETWIKYGNAGESTHDTTITYTYAFNLTKVNSSNESLTATFRLYDAATEGNEILLVYDEAKGYYRVAQTNEEGAGVIITAGNVTIVGLDDDTYYLEEIEAPTGYNKLTSRVEVIVSRVGTSNTYERLTETVVNYTGAELPSTGGVGTMLFITIGSIMIIGFGVLLVTKLRMSKVQA